MTTTLGLAVLEGTPHHPTLRILLDGEESLVGVDGMDQRNLVWDIVDTDALAPRDPPHRVALHGCRCGEFGCSALTTVVSADDAEVVWSAFRRDTARFDRALPDDAERHPDPVDDPEVGSTLLDLETRRFDRR